MGAGDDIYLGNPLLKKANVKIDFTKDQIQEYIKCKKIQYILPRTMYRSFHLMKVWCPLKCGISKKS